MITAHILTKNNIKTIQKTLESISGISTKILIGDYGSNDGTIEICKKFNTKIIDVQKLPRNIARKKLSDSSESEINFWIEPWETFLKNESAIKNFKNDTGYIRILQNNFIYWDVRIWRNNCDFLNPIFEKIDDSKSADTSCIFLSQGSSYCNDDYNQIQKWKKENPLSKEPLYYESFLLLSQGKYDDFLKSADLYLFYEKKESISSIMTRYHYAYVQLIHKKQFKPVLQNLNLCLCSKPLMAEFWCLKGDVYYHLLKKYTFAKEFYENAKILGSKRLSSDKCPMDISKYEKYPSKMIESCNAILNMKI